MFARLWRLSKRASQRGTLVRWGGFRGFMRPYTVSLSLIYISCSPPQAHVVVGFWRGVHTPRSSSPSSLWRGMTVTSSISHKKAISGGVSPGGRGNAMVATRKVWLLMFDIIILHVVVLSFWLHVIIRCLRWRRPGHCLPLFWRQPTFLPRGTMWSRKRCQTHILYVHIKACS
jgi:hypothetical protein